MNLALACSPVIPGVPPNTSIGRNRDSEKSEICNIEVVRGTLGNTSYLYWTFCFWYHYKGNVMLLLYCMQQVLVIFPHVNSVSRRETGLYGSIQGQANWSVNFCYLDIFTYLSLSEC